MPVTRDILLTWRDPRAVYRHLLAMGPREDRAIAYLMAACLLVFIAQWPRLVRLSQGIDFPAEPLPELDRLMAYEFMGWMMVWPLVMYGIAGLSRVILRVFRVSATGYGTRLALFWALLATTPAMLFYGLLRGFNGDVLATRLAGAVWVGAFIVFWVQGLRVAGEERYATP
jgi:hypothetical protein